ncbi:MAG TPA: preprotein translocase subunit SecG [Gemmatimonadaceae bacterium]|jgi:preprotein translocase subunit SecG
MFTFLLVLLIIDSLVLIAAILLQSGKGSGLAASFGGVSSSADSLLGTRQAGNLLTRASWWGGAIFLFLAFVLSLSSARQRAPKSVLDEAFTQPPAPVSAPAPTQGAPAPTSAGGVNLTPAEPTTAPATTPAGTAPATPAPKKP